MTQPGTGSPPLSATVTIVCLLLSAAAARSEAQSWSPPVGIPTPPIGTAPPTGAYTHYVDNTSPSATDTANPKGSATLPRRTIPTSLAAGSVVEVHGGPYTYSSDPSWSVSGSASSRILVRGVGSPVIQSDGPVLTLGVNGSYAVVDGFAFEHFQIALGGSYLALTSSEVRNYSPPTNSAAITGHGSNLVVLGNHIHHNGSATSADEIDIHGVKFGSGSSSIWVLDNVIHENGGDEIQLGDSNSSEPWVHHVYFGRNTGYGSRENCVDIKRARDVIVSENDCSRYKPSNSSSGETIVVHNTPERVWILNNKIHDTTLGVVTSSNGSSPIYVVGNVFYRIQHPAGSSYNPASLWASGHAVQSWTTGRIEIVNNTMQDVDAGIAFPGGDDATVRIVNNVIGRLLQTSHHVALESSAASRSTLKNTLMLAPSRIKWGDSHALDLASFKAAYPAQCGGCTDADPLFTNAAAYDLTPLLGSPAINTGVADAVYGTFQSLYGISIARDVAGMPRPQGPAWDMGAYEPLDSIEADLSITKTNDATSVLAGSAITYTIVISNAGPANALGATVNDTFPGSLSGVSWSCSASAGASCGVSGGTGNIVRSVDLPAGGSVRFVASGVLALSATGSLANTATVSVPEGRIDPVPANNSATDTDPILRPADVSVTKTDGQSTVVPGQAITYSIVVSNKGPNGVSGVTVTDMVPASLLSPSWTCTAALGASCGSASGSGNITQTVNLPTNGRVTYALSGTLSSNPTTLSNTATVSLPAGYGDPDTSDNAATDTDLILCGGEPALVADGRSASLTVGAGATRWLLLATQPDSSFSLEIRHARNAIVAPTVTLFRGDDGCSGTSHATSRTTTTISPAFEGGLRLSFRATGSSPSRIQVTNGSGAAVHYAVALSETTLYSAAWSTNGSYDTYYSLRNTTNATINATLVLTRTDGSVGGQATIAIPAQTSASANTVALAVPRGATGSVSLTHDGPPGALLVDAAIANFSTQPPYVQPVKVQTLRETR